MQKKSSTAVLFLLLITVLWAGTFSLIKDALQDISPTLFVTIRLTFASIVFLPFALPAFKNLSSKSMKQGFWLGLSFCLGFLTQTIGLQYTTATKSAFITGTFVVFTPLFQTILEKKKPKAANIIGIVFILAGIIFLSSKENSLLSVFREIGENINIGDIITLFSAIIFSIYMVYLDIVSPENDYRFLTFAQLSVTAVVSALFLALFGLSSIEPMRLTWNAEVIGAIVYTALGASIIATAVQTKYQHFVTPTRAVIVFSMEPLFASIIAYFYLNEVLHFFGIFGAVLIFAGLLISELFSKRSDE